MRSIELSKMQRRWSKFRAWAKGQGVWREIVGKIAAEKVKRGFNPSDPLAESMDLQWLKVQCATEILTNHKLVFPNDTELEEFRRLMKSQRAELIPVAGEEMWNKLRIAARGREKRKGKATASQELEWVAENIDARVTEDFCRRTAPSVKAVMLLKWVAENPKHKAAFWEKLYRLRMIAEGEVEKQKARTKAKVKVAEQRKKEDRDDESAVLGLIKDLRGGLK